MNAFISMQTTIRTQRENVINALLSPLLSLKYRFSLSREMMEQKMIENLRGCQLYIRFFRLCLIEKSRKMFLV